MAEVCKRVADAGADAIADPDAKFAAWLQSRDRVGQRTNVEIAQVGEGKPLPAPGCTGHDDPRCFNVTNLYGIIAGKMAHPAATIYGLEPKYGGPSDRSANVSWTKAMCHADPPA